MTKQTHTCTIESAGDGHMVIWLGKHRIEATCNFMTQGTITRLTGTVRNGPTTWLNCEIEVTTSDNEHGALQRAA